MNTPSLPMNTDNTFDLNRHSDVMINSNMAASLVNNNMTSIPQMFGLGSPIQNNSNFLVDGLFSSNIIEQPKGNRIYYFLSAT